MNGFQELFGYPIAAATMDEAVGLCKRAIEERRPLQIGVVNAAKIVNAEDDPALRTALDSCDVILADGQSVVWASRLLGRPLPERITGIDLFTNLLAYASQEGRSVFLLGATDEVQRLMREKIAKDYPNAHIVGSRNGYFSDLEASDIAEEIAQAQPDMLFLGMTSPKKEIFMDRFGERMGVPVVHGVGGSFDILAGITKRAPEGWQKAGMEWAYRVVQEPGRMWKRYLRTNFLFVFLLMREFARPTARHLELMPVPPRAIEALR